MIDWLKEGECGQYGNRRKRIYLTDWVCVLRVQYAAFFISEIGSTFFRTVVIGDFTKEEARAFFNDRALPNCGTPESVLIKEIDDESWESIYQVEHHVRGPFIDPQTLVMICCESILHDLSC